MVKANDNPLTSVSLDVSLTRKKSVPQLDFNQLMCRLGAVGPDQTKDDKSTEESCVDTSSFWDDDEEHEDIDSVDTELCQRVRERGKWHDDSSSSAYSSSAYPRDETPRRCTWFFDMAAVDTSDEGSPGANELDGRWCTPDGPHFATINGSVITWYGVHEGRQSVLRRLGDRLWSIDFEDETPFGKLQPDGRLMWDDGEVWIREELKSDGVGRGERPAPDCKIQVGADEAQGVVFRDRAALPKRAGNHSILDGDWFTPGGELIAAIKRDQIFWLGSLEGTVSTLRRVDRNEWSAELGGEDIQHCQLERCSEGGCHLLWDDGEIWERSC